MVVHCPAKVNLFLAVGPLDEFGYHPIRTMFQAVGLFDELHVEVADRDEMTCKWDDLPTENTVTKALRLLREFSDVPPLKLHLEKRIPAQAGLGGGSSDAAGLLRAVNRLVPVPFQYSILREVAEAVGADVAFFLHGGRAEGTRYGEKLTPIDEFESQWIVIVKPEAVSCSTPEAYGRLDSIPNRETDLLVRPEPFLNDFELVMPRECEDWKRRLHLVGATYTLLCGSGSAIFGTFESEGKARDAADDINRHKGSQAWAVPFLNTNESKRIDD